MSGKKGTIEICQKRVGKVEAFVRDLRYFRAIYSFPFISPLRSLSLSLLKIKIPPQFQNPRFPQSYIQFITFDQQREFKDMSTAPSSSNSMSLPNASNPSISAQFTYSNASYFPVPFHVQQQSYAAAPPLPPPPVNLPSVYQAQPPLPGVYTLPQYQQVSPPFFFNEYDSILDWFSFTDLGGLICMILFP